MLPDPHYDHEVDREQDRYDEMWATEMARIDRLEDYTPARAGIDPREALRIVFDLMEVPQ